MDTVPLAQAIRDNKPQPDVYLRFGHTPKLTATKVCGRSDLHEVQFAPNVTYLSWFYFLDTLSLQATYCTYDRAAIVLPDHWHPKRGTTRLIVADFR